MCAASRSGRPPMGTSHSDTLTLACELIARGSTTPDDAGCQQLMGQRLADCGFTLEPMRFGDVDNLWARRGHDGPVLCFAGHTDVVPAGPGSQWDTSPFTPEIRDRKSTRLNSSHVKISYAVFC